MKIAHFATATAAVALLGGAAYAQDQTMPKEPTPGSVTAPADSSASTGMAAPLVDAGVASSTSATTSTDVTVAAPAATDNAQAASVTTSTVTNGPVPDTAENRAKYGQPLSRAGKRSAARGN